MHLLLLCNFYEFFLLLIIYINVYLYCSTQKLYPPIDIAEVYFYFILGYQFSCNDTSSFNCDSKMKKLRYKITQKLIDNSRKLQKMATQIQPSLAIRVLPHQFHPRHQHQQHPHLQVLYNSHFKSLYKYFTFTQITRLQLPNIKKLFLVLLVLKWLQVYGCIVLVSSFLKPQLFINLFIIFVCFPNITEQTSMYFKVILL